MAPHKIADWNDADHALAQLGELRRNVAALEVVRDQTLGAARSAYTRDSVPVLRELNRLEAALKAFVDEHREDLEGRRSRKLEHGTVAYRWTKKITIAGKRVKGAIEWLLAAKRMEYLHVEHKLNKEALREAPAPTLKAIGARVTETDQFRYEVDDVAYPVED